MSIFWNTIDREQILILLGEETDPLKRRYCIEPALADEPRDRESSEFVRWLNCRRWCADRWNQRHEAAFASAGRLLDKLVAERDARDAGWLGGDPWPWKPFDVIRWRRVNGAANVIHVAWHDGRGQLRIARVRLAFDQVREPLVIMGGDELGADWLWVFAHLSLDLAKSNIGPEHASFEDPPV